MNPQKLRTFLLGLVFALSLPAAAGSQQNVKPSLPAATARPNYVVGASDILSVTIYGDGDLSRDYRVENDGYLRMPLLRERVKAAGLTIEELQTNIANAFTQGGLLRNPQVMVWVKENKSAFVTLSGNFQNPRVIEYNSNLSLLQAVALGNGLNANAGSTIVVLRKASSGEVERTVIPMKELMDGRSPALNVMLQAGDEISVPRQDFIFVGGAVGKNGPIPMGDTNDWTVLRALLAAGNSTRFAKLDMAVLRRTLPNGAVQEIPINAKKIMGRKAEDVPMIANDILLIPESSGRKALLRAVESALSIGTGAVIVNAGR